MINNRQAGRRRGRGGNGGGGGGGSPRGNMGRPDSGNRIDNRARGNAAQLHEKYRNLAREAQMQGDRVNTEYYLQFADHYFRVLSEQQRGREDQQPRRQNDAYEDVFNGNLGDDDYGDEGEPIRGNEQSQPQARDDRDGRRDGQREFAQRDGGQRDGNRRDEQRDGQRENQREAAQRDGGERPRHAEGERRPRPDRDTERRPRVEREQPRVERELDEVTANAEAVVPVNVPMPVSEVPAEAPRRRGRPRREQPVEQTPLDHRDAAPAFEADRLPPSLGISAVASNDTEDAPKPRRRRVRAEPPEASAAE